MAAGGLAAGNLVIKHIGFRVDALTATAWQYMLGGLPLLGASLMLEDMAQVAWTPTFVAGLLFLGLVGSAGASWVWYCLVRDGELIPLNGLTLLTPVFALGLAILVYQERVSGLGVLGIALVLVGVTWVGWPRRSMPAVGEVGLSAG
jgi:drug/metabolite transporter (DMT)-like permease